ncbi:uncharacterized protein LOC126318222 [Schistocerca gregaria]|uniref:uncharacterized protein LOC126318222 n=1 Tax=Schistocerca gregaria TaxID=7010 RepID=UPI00211DB280|nr:uncharacterized protein LOC126318222 [Schistocerca gregaria]
MSSASGRTLLARFLTPDGEQVGPAMSVPETITASKLSLLLNKHILKNPEQLPYNFYLQDEGISSTLIETLERVRKSESGKAATKEGASGLSEESILKIVYEPQAIFRVRRMTRCSSSLPGHTEAILSVQYSPDGKRLATASGDTTVRLWDSDTETPYSECRGHTNWVLCVRWSPDGRWVASGSMDKTVRLWNPRTGEMCGVMSGHSQFVTALDWEPLHVNSACRRLVSASKDGQAKVWDVVQQKCLFSLTSHTMSVTSVRWGGEGLIYTASQDRTIKVWSASDGRLVRNLVGHGHWVNTLSLNTDYALRTGAYDHTGREYSSLKESQERALQRWTEVKGKGSEILASGSDDTTVYLWAPGQSDKPIKRLTGHARLINIVSWSPNGRHIVTASFDKNLKLWTQSGKFVASFRGHVGEVYQVSWSSDSRLLVSGSKDSTLKVWDIETKKLAEELPGHADEVYAVDWAPDGQHVASGSKDRLLKIWAS